MRQKNKSRLNKRIAQDCLICAGAVLLIVLFFATGLLNTQKVWPDVKLDHVQADASYNLAEGDTYGVKATGPYYDLPEGSYRIRWQINGDGANTIRFMNSSGGKISPSEVFTVPGEWQGETYIEIEEPVHNFYINVEFTEGTWMEIYNFRLYSPEYTDGAWIAAIVVFGLLILVLLYRHGWLNEQHREALCIFGLAVLVIAAPALSKDAIQGIDLQYHAARLMNLAEGLKTGPLPVRIGGFSYNGYGAVTSQFYPDALLYPFAGMLLGGASIAFVINLIRIVSIVAMMFTMYVAVKRIQGSHRSALCAAVVYACSPFCIDCLYRLSAQGQIQALAVIPLFILGVWEVIWGDKERWLVLVASATLICQSHLLSTLLCAGASLVVGVIYLPQILREKRLRAIVKAIVVTVLINLFFILPLAANYLSGEFTTPVQFGFVDSAIPIKNLFTPDKWIGLPVCLGIMAFYAYAAEKTPAWHMANRFCMAGCLFALLSTTLIPWSHIVVLTRELITVLQFPWRFMILATPLLCLCAGYGYELVFGKMKAGRLLVLGIALSSVCPILSTMVESEEVLEFGTGVNPYMATPEYQIIGSNLELTRGRTPQLLGDLELVEYQKEGTRITAEVKGKEGGSVDFPLFAFEGYKAEIDGQEIAIARGENNRIRVDIPSGMDGTLCIWFAGKLLWRIADAVSLVTALGLAICWIKRKMRRSYATEIQASRE